MISKLCGALTLMVGFYGIGFVMKHKRRQEVLMLQQMQYMLDNLICDLQYQQYPLYRLMKKAEDIVTGDLCKVFGNFAAELESQIAPNAACCMSAAVSSSPGIPASVRKNLMALGQAFSRLDAEGQLRCLEAVQTVCKKDCACLEDKLSDYVRCCHAYSLGAGAVLALILL